MVEYFLVWFVLASLPFSLFCFKIDLQINSFFTSRAYIVSVMLVIMSRAPIYFFRKATNFDSQVFNISKGKKSARTVFVPSQPYPDDKDKKFRCVASLDDTFGININ